MQEASVDIAQKYHQQILTFLNTRLSETFNFYTPILAAATGFGLSLLKTDIGDDTLLVAYVVSGILLWGGVAYIFSTSYTYRNFQITLEQVEKYIGLEGLTHRWHITPKLRKTWWENRSWITPEILKPHLCMATFTFYLITLVYFIRLYTKGIISTWYYDSVSSAILLVGHVAFVILLDRHYYGKLTRDVSISQRAHELYERRGHQHGHDLDDWLQAENEITRGV
jgi:hypothetical protein